MSDLLAPPSYTLLPPDGGNQRFALGDIVLTDVGYGRVVDVPPRGKIVVLVFGEGVYRYDRDDLMIVQDDTATEYGIGLIDRQAVIIRSLRVRIAELEQALARVQPTDKPISVNRGFLQDGE